ncbi:MAG: TlyA family RNA methyltransferase [Clostridiales bacterium]|jgi:23S rRNA (cytidine1920-2'-O)/16S rRNA (cytidine1409-2'-O)-methyltransferase|nr:TlyA family RNA methyltransferase [Clostridiales bacterium]
MKKVPIWSLLVNEGFFEDRKAAESWIMSGSVLVNEKRIATPGQIINPADKIRIKGHDRKYVSKGGLKLEGALTDFNIDVRGRVAIDAGASTGGFTDCLLQHGADLVYAVDAGHGQLAGKLRLEDKVVNMEKTNISDSRLLCLNPRPDFATVDLSYISLKKAIPVFADIMKNEGEMLCLVKPLFEVEDSDTRRTGKIEDINIYREILIDLYEYINSIGHTVTGITHSHVTGNKGTREFFLRVLFGRQKSVYSFSSCKHEIDKAIDNVMKIDVFKKA